MSLSLCLCSVFAMAQETPAPPPPSLSELASAADLVAVVQVADVDYQYVREKIPNGGTAFLRTLIPYKLSRPREDFIDVYEEGLHEYECYFRNPPITEEGSRHLVFLRDNPDVADQYLGMPRGCALLVLVRADNRYALRYPLSGITVSDDVSELAEPMEFRDSHAVRSDDDLSVAERNDLLERGLLIAEDDGRFRYTHGIALEHIRALLGEENLTRDRTLLRPADPAYGSEPEQF